LQGNQPVGTPNLTPERAVIRQVWQETQQATQAVWERYTLKDLCQQRDSLRQKDLMYYI
jgi:DNA-binding IscR family transcriptional regulator